MYVAIILTVLGALIFFVGILWASGAISTRGVMAWVLFASVALLVEVGRQVVSWLHPEGKIRKEIFARYGRWSSGGQLDTDWYVAQTAKDYFEDRLGRGDYTDFIARNSIRTVEDLAAEIVKLRAPWRYQAYVAKWGPREREAEIAMKTPRGETVNVPAVFDEERIRRDLAKYMHSETALQTYLGGLALRFKTEQHKRVVQKLIEYMGIRKDLYLVAYEARKAQGQLGRADAEDEIERKRLELQRRQVELEIEQVGTLKAKELERDVARLERELEELRRKPEPPTPPTPQESPEQYAARRADMLIKYAAEVKRIRESVSEPELAEDLVDHFLSDIRKREGE